MAMGRLTVSVVIIGSLLSMQSVANDEPVDLFSLSLEQLMELPVTELGSLTSTSLKKTPAAITRINEQDIVNTGARSLFELLDITVPGVQWIRHQWSTSHLGTRGIISNTDDKVMIRVNGRVMNERTHFGAVSERDFPMLSDIYSINVIRGAGSSLYGLGAVSMVIDITTHSANTKEGVGLTLRSGGVYQFNSFEGHFSKTFQNDLGLYFYAAIGDVKGADEEDAPIIFGTDITTKTGKFVERGTPAPGPEKNDGSQFHDLAPVKLHLQLTSEETDFWLRYTRSGETQMRDIGLWAEPPVGGDTIVPGSVEIGFQQTTAMLERRFKVSEEISVTGVLSFDSQSFDRELPNDEPDYYANSHREDEWFGKVTAQWRVNDNNEVAFGSEVSHEKFGLKSHGDGSDSPVNARLGREMQDWSTNTVSLFGEWQWHLSEQWTTFIGGRADKNRYTDVLYSPRAAVVWSPSKRDALKLLLTRSQRMNAADQNRATALEGVDESDSEKLDNLELRYERTEQSSHFAISTFYLKLDAIGWDSEVSEAVLVGTQKQWGVELEFEKQVGLYLLTLSHAYSKLIDFDLKGQSTLITAEPFGFGNDIANWSNHITKAMIAYQLGDRLQLSSSLRYYWGFPGSEDYRDKYVADGASSVDADWEQGYDKQVFLNFGANYHLGEESSIRIDLYNVLGWIDKDYNKRAVTDSWGFYRSEAAAFALSFTTNF